MALARMVALLLTAATSLAVHNSALAETQRCHSMEYERNAYTIATNAGMFDAALKPVSLYVEQGREFVHASARSVGHLRFGEHLWQFQDAWRHPIDGPLYGSEARALRAQISRSRLLPSTFPNGPLERTS